MEKARHQQPFNLHLNTTTDHATTFLNSACQPFNHCKHLGEKTIEQLDDAQLLCRADADANSIAIIVQHLHGNMRSRWTDFLTTDGEKE